MWRRSLTFVLAAASIVLVPRCQSATYLRIEPYTNAACSDVGTTNVMVGVAGELEEKLPSASAPSGCSEPEKSLGSVVIVPSGADDGEVAVKIVTGLRKSADQCVAPDYRGCIVARRSLRFSPGEPVDLRVLMDLRCVDVPCGALDTCFEGKCVSTACIDDPTTCVTPPVEDAGSPPPPPPPVDEGGAPDAAPDASCACTTGDRRCNAAGTGVEVCTPPAGGGCGAFTASAAPADVCGANEECSGLGAASACTCKPSACTQAGPKCLGGALATCAVDADGCNHVAATTSCGGQTCQVARCGCDTNLDCSAGFECSPITRSCVPDDVGPGVNRAFMVTSTKLRVVFDEDVANAAAAARYCVEAYDGDGAACAQTGAFSIASVAMVDARTYDLTLSAAAAPGTYSVAVNGITDTTGNAVAAPAYADFTSGEPLNVVRATATSTTTLEVELSAPLNPATAACANAAACALKYKLVGASALGSVASAVVQPAPRDNVVVLTHANAQVGALYTVVVANATNGDGFDDAGQSVTAASGGAMTTSPRDRAIFLGRGAPVSTLGGGPFAEDLLGDGSSSAYAFRHRQRIYAGQSRDGRFAARFAPDGSEPETITFTFAKDTNGAGGSTSSNSSPGPFLSIGYAGCTANTTGCGPDNENGRSRFGSVTIAGVDWLVMGGNRSGGNLDYVYLSDDDDARLDFQYVDITNNTGGGSNGLSEMTSLNGRAFFGIPDTGGSKPYLVSLNAAPAAGTSGLDATQNANGSCVLASHQSCDLSGGTFTSLKGNTIIDFLSVFGSRLYLGNSGALYRSTTATPLDQDDNPSHWVAITPTAAAYTAKTSITTTKTSAIEPADKAFAQMAVYNGRVYVGRNTTTGPQLWSCDPAATGSATDCDAGDWSLAAPNTAGDAQLSQMNVAANAKLTMVVASGPYLYVGYDNAGGVTVYRTSAANPVAVADFAQVGTSGLGRGASNARFLEASSTSYRGAAYLYAVVGDGTGAARVYRSVD